MRQTINMINLDKKFGWYTYHFFLSFQCHAFSFWTIAVWTLLKCFTCHCFTLQIYLFDSTKFLIASTNILYRFSWFQIISHFYFLGHFLTQLHLWFFTFFTCNFLPGQKVPRYFFGMIVRQAKLHCSMVWPVIRQSKVGGGYTLACYTGYYLRACNFLLNRCLNETQVVGRSRLHVEISTSTIVNHNLLFQYPS